MSKEGAIDTCRTEHTDRLCLWYNSSYSIVYHRLLLIIRPSIREPATAFGTLLIVLATATSTVCLYCYCTSTTININTVFLYKYNINIIVVLELQPVVLSPVQ